MKKIRDIFSGNEGFTLIELLIVIVIIGVLAAIAVPNIAGLGDSANEEAIVANMRTLMVELESFKAQGGTITNAVADGSADFSAFNDVTVNGNTFTFSGAQALAGQVDAADVTITSGADTYTITVTVDSGNVIISDGSITIP